MTKLVTITVFIWFVDNSHLINNNTFSLLQTPTGLSICVGH